MKQDDPFVQLGESRFEVAPLAPGASATVKVPLTIVSQAPPGYVGKAPGNQCTLDIRIAENVPPESDSRGRAILDYTLALPINADKASQGMIRQPMLAFEAATPLPDGQVQIVARVIDDNPRLVSVFLEEDKVELSVLEPLGDGQDHLLSAKVKLNDGLNRLTFIGLDHDDVSTALPLRLWKDPVSTAATP